MYCEPWISSFSVVQIVDFNSIKIIIFSSSYIDIVCFWCARNLSRIPFSFGWHILFSFRVPLFMFKIKNTFFHPLFFQFLSLFKWIEMVVLTFHENFIGNGPSIEQKMPFTNEAFFFFLFVLSKVEENKTLHPSICCVWVCTLTCAMMIHLIRMLKMRNEMTELCSAKRRQSCRCTTHNFYSFMMYKMGNSSGDRSGNNEYGKQTTVWMCWLRRHSKNLINVRKITCLVRLYCCNARSIYVNLSSSIECRFVYRA